MNQVVRMLRTTTLPMGWLIAVAAWALSPQALAQQAIDETRATGESPYVDIEHMNGKALIKGWNKQEVRVFGELGERTEEFIFTSDQNQVVIKVEVARSRNDWKFKSHDDGDDLTIYLPMNSNVNYQAINADLIISDFTNDTNVEVVNGDVEAKSLSGRVNLESVNGDIDLAGVSGDVSIETVNGDISGDHRGDAGARFESVNGDIKVTSNSPEVLVETVNGDIDLGMESIRELDLVTVNGRIEASMQLSDSGDVRASSVGGTIELNFQQDVSARFDIEAHAGGHIINNITDDEMMKAKYGPRRWLEFTHNGGGARVEVSTVSGRITLNN